MMPRNTFDLKILPPKYTHAPLLVYVGSRPPGIDLWGKKLKKLCMHACGMCQQIRLANPTTPCKSCDCTCSTINTSDDRTAETSLPGDIDLWSKKLNKLCMHACGVCKLTFSKVSISLFANSYKVFIESHE